jgi:hypothetical protein
MGLTMIRKLLGYLFAFIGFIGLGFFRYYKGTVISYPFLSFCISIAIGIIGWYFISTSKSNKQSKQKRYEKEQLNKLKANAERITLNVDNCEIRENDYYEEYLHESMTKSQMIDASFDSNRNSSQHHVIQSAIIYYYQSTNGMQKMISQSFPFNAETLKNYIETKSIILYVDRFDKKKYRFELG